MKESAPSVRAKALLVGLHLRWNGVWQRPNHVVARLARLVPVLVVEEPLVAREERDAIVAQDGLHVLTPHRSAPADAVDAATIAAALDWLAGRDAALWLYSPMMLPLASAAPQAPLVYDKMDQLSAFLGADPRLAARERAVLERAAVVFAGGASLWNTVAGRARRGLALPSGVDVAHFASALEARPHPALDGLPHPLFGYIGVIDERLDLALIAALADARPDATLVLVGPVAKIAPAALPKRTNIVYLGPRSYAELPQLLAAFDVALMPFAIGPATEFISPTKTLEYLAAGRPVVSTPVPDVVLAFSDVVRVATGSTEFVAAVAAAERDPERSRAAGIERARATTWDGVVDVMLHELGRAGVALGTVPAPAISRAPT